LISTLKNRFFERVIFVPDFRLACPGGITSGGYHVAPTGTSPTEADACVADQSGLHRPGSVVGLCFVVFSHVEFCICQFVWSTAWKRWQPVLRLFTVPSVGLNSGADCAEDGNTFGSDMQASYFHSAERGDLRERHQPPYWLFGFVPWRCTQATLNWPVESATHP